MYVTLKEDARPRASYRARTREERGINIYRRHFCAVIRAIMSGSSVVVPVSARPTLVSRKWIPIRWHPPNPAPPPPLFLRVQKYTPFPPLLSFSVGGPPTHGGNERGTRDSSGFRLSSITRLNVSLPYWQ